MEIEPIKLMDDWSQLKPILFVSFPNYYHLWIVSKQSISVETTIGLQNIVNISEPYSINFTSDTWQSDEGIVYFILDNPSSQEKLYYALAPSSLARAPVQ